MRSRAAVTIALACAVVWLAPGLAQQTAEQLYQTGLYQEEVTGDLQQAIRIYERILAEHGSNRAVAAQAQLHVGICQETLGHQEARRAYQRVLDDYGDQADVVSQARARLAALGPAVAPAAGPVARLLLSSQNPSDQNIENPRAIVPSPDGRRIAYFQSAGGTGGDNGISIRDLATGEVELLASGPPSVVYRPPVWSFDGKRLAFTESDTGRQAGVVRILDLSSRDVQSVPVPDGRRLYLLDWTRDGRSFLCNDFDRQTLELMSITDGTLTTLAESVWPWQRATFSPDGRFVAYGAGPHTQESLYVQSLADGSRRRIAESGGQMYLHPLWSPDGTAIAHQQTDGIWVIPMADGAPSGPARLAYRTESPRWAVAWTAAGGLHFTANEQRNVPLQVEVDPDTGTASGSGTRELTEYPRGLRSFRWSPDGRRVALTGWSSGFTVYSVDSKVSRSFDNVELDWAVALSGGMWSPDGQELWYERVTTPASGAVRRGGRMQALDLATGQIRELFALAGNVLGISLSADAQTMAFVRQGPEGTPTEIVVAETGRADGQVVATPEVQPPLSWLPLAPNAAPQLSPAGDRVLYIVERTGNVRGNGAPPSAGLWVVGRDGAEPRQLANAARLFSAVWHPNGELIAYTGQAAAPGADTFLRVVNAETGAVHDIPVEKTDTRMQLMDWSADGRFLGFIRLDVWWEYWAVQGLLANGLR